MALVLQVLSFVVTLLLIVCLDAIFGVAVHVVLAATLQGGIAAALSRVCKQAPWWLAIQFFFPIVLVLLLGLHLPPTLFLGAFLILLLLYWSTYRTQVPFYPSRMAAWQAVESLLPSTSPIRIIDIGSGLGGLSLHLAKQRPDDVLQGIEIAPLPWFISRLRARFSRRHVDFVRGDYRDLDFAQYDVIFAYLSPAAMPDLWQKARAEMRPGTLLLSYEFQIPDVPAEIVMRPEEKGPELYGWKM
ncbi:MAG: class I SAM-dependent methyltransferase [Oxalicibacterium faecigallinarum]|uniref:class I SAM-dependent methyltransferase n=1 Tax=Oxalicibacterium faecigallinarum TaxID=573741 RepID=UPI0028081B06|nr:class I SAM-dependent methyltransferase [Oxalicibacterium faecigallinarum]MDQ7970065.1 class I SAM-dependent methyltransferase [Oxalicibacterium faecigallinarum]